MRHGRHRRGFTLLEVLVATTIMGIAVGSLLSALSGSVRNAARLADTDRASGIARRTMDELLAAPAIPYGSILEGRFNAREAGLDGGWRARVEPFETVPGQPSNLATLERVVLEVWWSRGSGRRTMVLDGYRRVP
jgi:general secretion pathway protein I